MCVRAQIFAKEKQRRLKFYMEKNSYLRCTRRLVDGIMFVSVAQERLMK